MKQFLKRMLLVALLCVPWVTNAQSSLTVADGTETNGYVPIYGFYNDALNRIQILYPADSISAMQGSSINSLTFYSANASGSWGAAQFTIKMATVTQTSLTDYLSDDLFTTCWEGSFEVVNSVAYIELDDPFLYTGDNLVIQIWNTPGSYSSSSFYGVTLNGASIQNYNYNGVPSSGANARNFLPKTTFEYGTITCPRPSALTITPNNDQATVTWTAGGNETSWIVYVNDEPVDVASTTSYTMTNLTSNTLYTVGVRAFCGVDDTSAFVSTSFRSQCFDYTPTPYVTGFEDDEDGEMPSCWSALATGTSSSGTFPSVYEYSSNARNGNIYFEFESNYNGYTEIAALPPMEDISTLQLDFYAACMNTNFILEVGVIEDDSVFVPVDTVALTAGVGNNWHNSYYPYTVYFDQYDGDGERMAMRVTSTSSYTLMIDDISVTEIPNCLPPTHFVIDSIGIDWVGLGWTDDEGSGWEIIYDTLPIDLATTELIPVESSDNFVVLTGLMTGLEYTAYLRGDCGGENSPWVGPLTFVPGQFNMSFSGTDTLRGCGITVYDFDGSGYDEYTANANSMLVLYPSSEDSLIVFSGSTDIYSYYAHLRIYDGVGTNGTLLWQSSNDYETIPLTSSFSGPITIHFNAGSYNYGGTGFEIQTSCVAAPQCAVVNNLQVPNVGVGSVYVEWGVSGLNLGVPTGYEVNCYDTNGSVVYNGTVTGTNAMISNLAPGTPYSVSVRTVCDNDNYGEYETVSFTTASLACVEVDLTNSHFDTIGNGTTTYDYLPSYGYYNYSLTQQIYTAAEIGHSGLITAISMMPAAVASQRIYEIYLAHTSDSVLSGFIHPADMTLVYNGDPNTMTANQWIEYVLDQPFNYNGSDNLLVCFRDMTGSWTSGNTWYTHTTNGSMGCYIYQDASAYNPFTYTGGNATTNRNNIAISMMECSQLASCAAPIVVVDTIATDFVGISWGAGYQETSWMVEYRADTSDVWISEGTTSAESWSFANLAVNVRYHFRVGAICSDTTMYAEVSVLTKCGSEALPFIYGFEDFPATGYPACWYKATTYSYDDYPMAVTDMSHSGNYSLFMGSGSGSYSYIVLPEFAAELDTLELNFWVNAPLSYYTNELLVGVMTDAENFNTFQSVAIVSPSEIGVWEAVRIRFNQYTGNGTRIAFVSPVDDDVQMLIDDISVNIISPCSSVENVSLVYATPDSAVIAWNAGGNNYFEYVYGPSGFVLDSGSFANTTFDTIVLEGLTANTQYDIYVRTICGDGDTSNWSNAFSFRTGCVKITAVPFNEGFENNVPGWSSPNSQNLYPCWYRSNDPNDSYYYPYVDNYSAHTGNYGLFWYWSSYYGFNPYIVMPAIDTDYVDISSMQLSFWGYNDGYGDVPQVAIGTMTNPQAIATFQPLDTVSITGLNWTKYEVPLVNYNGNGEYIAVLSVNAGSNWTAYFDDFTIDSIPSCMHVYDLALAGSTSNSVTLSWTEMGGSTTWEIAVDTLATATPVADTVVTGSTTATITGLTSGATYYFWVRSVCSSTESSTWEGPVVGVPGSWFMRPNQTDTVSMCGGIIYDDGGIDGDYSSSQDSYIILRPDNPGTLVTVSGSAYTEGQWDYLRIYDGEGTSGVELWNDYGTTALQTFGPFVSSTGSITIYFHSDGSLTYDGFEINVGCVTDYCPVSDLALDSNGTTSNTLAVTWTGSSTSYDVVYGHCGFDVDTAGTALATNTNSISITNLNSLASYDVYVRGLCNNGDTGMWHKVTLQTPMCDNPDMVYSFDTTQTASVSNASPIGYSYYNNSYVQTIITADRLMDLTGDVTAMAFNAASTVAGSYFTNMTVWLSNVSEDRFVTDFILEDSTHVFTQVINSADFSYSTTGWQIHGFDNPFAWDGVSNILVSVRREHGSWSMGSSFIAHEDSVARTCFDYSDYTSYDPATAAVSYGDISTTVGDIMLISCAAGCGRPNGLYATNVTYQSATLNWNGSADDYEVAVKAATDATWPAEVAVSNASTYSATGLLPNTQYQFRVRAICDADEGLISDWVEGTFTTAELPCFAPTDLQADTVGYTNATLSWSADASQSQWTVHVWNNTFDSLYIANSNPFTVAGLEDVVSYSAAVKSVCGGGLVESEYGDTITFTTATCAQVTGVVVSNVTSSSATVTWNGTASSYEVEYGTENYNQGTGTIIATSANTVSITGLDADETYDVYVRAVCEPGVISNWSAKVTFTTTAGGQTTYHIEVVANPAEGGTVTGTGDYVEGSTVTISATPNTGYEFVNWSDNVTTASRQITVTANATYTANFRETQGIISQQPTANSQLSIYPNPTTDATTIAVSGVNGEVQITIVDMNGRTVKAESMSCNGDCTKRMEVSGLAQGAYFVRVNGEGINMVRKLVVK